MDGRLPLFFYEQLSDFDQARFLVRIGTLMLGQQEPSFPSVSLGFRFFDSAYRTPTGELEIPQRNDPFRGRHYVTAIDHDRTDEIAFTNTWGGRWGDRGTGRITREYFTAHVDFVGVRWSAVAGPSPAMVDCLESLATRRMARSERIPHCWPTPNDFARDDMVFRDQLHELVRWTVMSNETRRATEVYEIRHPSRIAARAHLFFHSDDRDVASVREIFVNPRFRRRGYARMLESLITERVQQLVLRRIEMWLHEGDARPLTRPAAEGFASSCGYQWTDASITRPNIAAIAVKEL